MCGSLGQRHVTHLRVGASSLTVAATFELVALGAEVPLAEGEVEGAPRSAQAAR